MVKIDRKTQKIFCAGNPSDIGQYGSGAAGTKLPSTDLDVLQALAAYEQGWSDATIGGSKRPPLEEFNGLNYINTTQLSYLFQEGIAEYDPGTTYYINSVVKESGTYNLYGSLTDDNIGNALSDVVNWQLLGNLSALSGISGLGTAAFEDTGTTDGTIPLIGVGDKLSSSLLEDATETVKGVAEVATQAETNTGTDDSTIITPQKLQNAILGFDYLLEQSASNSATIEFINLPLIDYSNFLFVISGVRPTNNAVNFSIRVSVDNGSSWNATPGYRYAMSGRHTGGGNVTDDATADNQIVCNDNGGGNQVGSFLNGGFNMNLQAFNLDSNIQDKQFAFQSVYATATAARNADAVGTGVFWATQLPVNGIQFFFNAGLIAEGHFELYGIR